jgi:hypothetical protein
VTCCASWALVFTRFRLVLNDMIVDDSDNVISSVIFSASAWRISWASHSAFAGLMPWPMASLCIKLHIETDARAVYQPAAEFDLIPV